MINMNKIISFIKNNKKFIIIFLIIIFFILIIDIQSKKTSGVLPSPTPQSFQTATFNDLAPGKSSKDDVLLKMGTALNAKIEESKETYEYRSSNPNFNTEVIVINDKLEYIKVIYTNSDNKNYSDFSVIYGDPEQVLYNADYSVGYILNSYPSKGVAFISHIKSKSVNEAWYFKPTTTEEFKSSLAIGYFESPNLSR